MKKSELGKVDYMNQWLFKKIRFGSARQVTILTCATIESRPNQNNHFRNQKTHGRYEKPLKLILLIFKNETRSKI